MVRFLLKKGSKLKPYHKKYLFLAAKKGNIDIVRLFIEYGYSIEVKDELNETLLFKAIRGKSLCICKYLISKGASISGINKVGESIDLLVSRSNHEIIQNYFKELKENPSKTFSIQKEENTNFCVTSSSFKSSQAKQNLDKLNWIRNRSQGTFSRGKRKRNKSKKSFRILINTKCSFPLAYFSSPS